MKTKNCLIPLGVVVVFGAVALITGALGASSAAAFERGVRGNADGPAMGRQVMPRTGMRQMNPKDRQTFAPHDHRKAKHLMEGAKRFNGARGGAPGPHEHEATKQN